MLFSLSNNLSELNGLRHLLQLAASFQIVDQCVGSLVAFTRKPDATYLPRQTPAGETSSSESLRRLFLFENVRFPSPVLNRKNVHVHAGNSRGNFFKLKTERVGHKNPCLLGNKDLACDTKVFAQLARSNDRVAIEMTFIPNQTRTVIDAA